MREQLLHMDLPQLEPWMKHQITLTLDIYNNLWAHTNNTSDLQFQRHGRVSNSKYIATLTLKL